MFTEGIMAFVEKKPDVEISIEELETAVKEIAAYKRPTHYVIMDQGETPLTRVGKTDYLALRERGESIAKELRTNGKWDA